MLGYPRASVLLPNGRNEEDIPLVQRMAMLVAKHVTALLHVRLRYYSHYPRG